MDYHLQLQPSAGGENDGLWNDVERDRLQRTARKEPSLLSREDENEGENENENEYGAKGVRLRAKLLCPDQFFPQFSPRNLHLTASQIVVELVFHTLIFHYEVNKPMDSSLFAA